MKVNFIKEKRMQATKKIIIPFIFLIYLLCGLFIVKDYGISLDEVIERWTSISNYVYVTEKLLISSDKETVRAAALHAEPLMTWHDRFYGTALQSVPVLIEHLNDFSLSMREIFLVRHIFTFLNYYLAAIFFYLILRKRWGRSVVSILGTLMFILYPRFFGESFYNIKDILFYSWCVIASYFALWWLENGRKSGIQFAAAMTLAISINTRILGISILLLSCAFLVVIDYMQKKDVLSAVKSSLSLILLTFICYVVITPFLWENPLKNSIDTFFHFMRFPGWNGKHLYLGEMIDQNVPWHYIPVWMGVTIPIIYIVLFVIGIIGIGLGLRKRYMQKVHILHMYDLFFAAMFFCTLFGFMILGVGMYEGWRHAYMIFLPFLYLSIFGLGWVFSLLSDKKIIFARGFACMILVFLGFQLVWIMKNHPYQYAYFSIFGRRFATENFSLDYWEVSHTDLVRYALNDSESSNVIFTMDMEGRPSYLLKEEEKARVYLAYKTRFADYYIEHTRDPYEEREAPENFFELKSITVDGIKISTLYKHIPTALYDYDAPSRIVSINAINSERIEHLIDDNYGTRWHTDRPQQKGDYLTIVFDEDVDYDYISTVIIKDFFTDYALEPIISISKDGIEWVDVSIIYPVHNNFCHYQFIHQPFPYRYLRIEVGEDSDENHWSVDELCFGHAINR